MKQKTRRGAFIRMVAIFFVLNEAQNPVRSKVDSPFPFTLPTLFCSDKHSTRRSGLVNIYMYSDNVLLFSS